ncbi:MAG: dihydropteroate synthase [Epsilonproteobacteria bacterium]|nr:dihydropteroate synthase [Campylobacterota bacterium]NPA57307.1 dihydropteroate synthase [Campylobacterota bacterium]
MQVVKVGLEELQDHLKRLGVEKGGREILRKKGRLHLFSIRGMVPGAANILKQDALSVGGDLAVPRGTVTCSEKEVEALLIVTERELERLIEKERAQPFGLKGLAQELSRYLHMERFPVKIMGIINATADSFYPGSRFMGERGVEAIERMVEEGADIIDIGGMSSRPGSREISEEEELERVRPIIDEVARLRLTERVIFSIDTYRPRVAAYALERGFQILNDITALSDRKTAEVAAYHGATVVLMHMQGRPETMQENPHYDHVVWEVSRFFQERIERAKGFGIERIILDPGIGFGKRLEDNLLLLRDLEEFRKFGYEVLVGASRKSMIDKIHRSRVEERLGGTLAIHLYAISRGASIIRCHDVYEHRQAIAVDRAIRGVL